jgi:hypothetical protein
MAGEPVTQHGASPKSLRSPVSSLECAMRRNPDNPSRHAGPMPTVRGDWSTIKGLLPYLWDFRGRVALALGCLFIAKLANVGVPLVLKDIVDALDQAKGPLALPIILLIGYGLLRLSSTLFAELRDIVFAKVAQRSIRNVALKTLPLALPEPALPPRAADRRHVPQRWPQPSRQ